MLNEAAIEELKASLRGELIQPPDLDAFREWNRTKKSRKLTDKLMTEQEAVSRFVYDGCYIGTELYGTVRCPMTLVREVVRQGVTDLRVAGQGVTELDLWLAAGMVKTLDITYIGLEVYGVSSALRREVETKIAALEAEIEAILAERPDAEKERRARLIALNEQDEYPATVSAIYKKRRDVLVDGLNRAGWKVEKPAATMFVWAEIPGPYADMGSLEFAKHLLREARVAVSPGMGFGPSGEGYVRFALIENRHRIRQAVRNIRRFLRDHGASS